MKPRFAGAFFSPRILLDGAIPYGREEEIIDAQALLATLTGPWCSSPPGSNTSFTRSVLRWKNLADCTSWARPDLFARRAARRYLHDGEVWTLRHRPDGVYAKCRAM